MDMEEGYRRGTVLGLTIAEIFILLVFLILLALMGVNRYWSDKLDPWKDIMAKTTPEEIEVALGQPGTGHPALQIEGCWSGRTGKSPGGVCGMI